MFAATTTQETIMPALTVNRKHAIKLLEARLVKLNKDADARRLADLKSEIKRTGKHFNILVKRLNKERRHPSKRGATAYVLSPVIQELNLLRVLTNDEIPIRASANLAYLLRQE